MNKSFEINKRQNCSLRSKRFCAVYEQRTRNESQRPHEKKISSRFISRAVKTENPPPRSSLLRNQTETLATQASKIAANLISHKSLECVPVVKFQ